MGDNAEILFLIIKAVAVAVINPQMLCLLSKDEQMHTEVCSVDLGSSIPVESVPYGEPSERIDPLVIIIINQRLLALRKRYDLHDHILPHGKDIA